MSNKDKLLVAAQECLYEKSYGRITARDIAAKAETSLAGIGYHYGTTEALLNEAVIAATERWGQKLTAALPPPVGDGQQVDVLERFEAIWTRIVELFEHHRPLWVAAFGAVSYAEHAPEIRAVLVDGIAQARTGLAAVFHGIDEDADDRAWAVGSLHQALLTGVMAQWLLDPEHAVGPRELTDALRYIVSEARPGPPPTP